MLIGMVADETINGQLSTINCQRSMVNDQWSTLRATVYEPKNNVPHKERAGSSIHLPLMKRSWGELGLRAMHRSVDEENLPTLPTGRQARRQLKTK
ncbi:MAG: hypothetical protein HY961_11735 [Ignavibacteriae bacterium]|nr:hypothetical protein [Ignavibacteriota bacterium]